MFVLLLEDEDDCVLTVCVLLSVSFAAVCTSACEKRREEILRRDSQLLVRGDACCISAVISDYNVVI